MPPEQTLHNAILDEATFVRLTASGTMSEALPWRRVVVRPVEIKGQRHLQVSYFDARQDVTKNFRGTEAEAKLDELLALPFTTVLVQTTAGDIQVQRSRKGKLTLRRHAPTSPTPTPDLNHDHAKAMPLPEGETNPFLQAVGIQDAQGAIRPRMRDKFRQVNEFLKLLEHTGELRAAPGRPLRILDAGCGSAYLTFALYDYLTTRRAIPTEIMGVEVREELVRQSAAQSAALGCRDTLCFRQGTIAAHAPDAPPDIVLALHACDTATDEALAQGIRWGARLIVAAPCCHHDLQVQLTVAQSAERRAQSDGTEEQRNGVVPIGNRKSGAPFGRIENPDVFRPVLRHGILKQRMGDLLTDAFRALILRILGYRAEVIEFVAAEHTDKNLMIRAVRSATPGEAAFVAEYQALKAFWGVTPALEGMVGERLTRYLGEDSGRQSPQGDRGYGEGQEEGK